jgi:hypothetical protein
VQPAANRTPSPSAQPIRAKRIPSEVKSVVTVRRPKGRSVSRVRSSSTRA